jgi:hypothetical protein
MGMNTLSSCSSSPYATKDSNPNPKVYKITRVFNFGKNLAILVTYPNCTNFEGNKILVYKNIHNLENLLKLTKGELDPHFSKGTSPFARFIPTEEGWNNAIKLCESIRG